MSIITHPAACRLGWHHWGGAALLPKPKGSRPQIRGHTLTLYSIASSRRGGSTSSYKFHFLTSYDQPSRWVNAPSITLRVIHPSNTIRLDPSQLLSFSNARLFQYRTRVCTSYTAVSHSVFQCSTPFSPYRFLHSHLCLV